MDRSRSSVYGLPNSFSFSVSSFSDIKGKMQEIQVVYLVMSEFPESLTEAGEKARPEEYKTLRKRACAYITKTLLN